MQRRVFVKLSAFTAAAITIPFVQGCGHTLDAESQPLFFSRLADIKTISETGKAYISQFKSENNAEKLKGLLLTQAGGAEDATAIRNALLKTIGADYKNNQIVTVSGWVLSQTEARQCALYYLLNA